MTFSNLSLFSAPTWAADTEAALLSAAIVWLAPVLLAAIVAWSSQALSGARSR